MGSFSGASDLRNRIAIRERKKVSNANSRGFTEEAWETKYEVWAKMEGLHGREFFAAAMVNAEQTVRFTIRFIDGLDTSMRILFKGKEYNITQVNPLEYRGDLMELLAMEVIPGGD